MAEQRAGRLRVLGLTCAASGVLGVAAGVLTVAWSPAVGDDVWSYPFPYAAGLVLGFVLAIVHLMTAAGYVGIRSLAHHRVAEAASSAAIAGLALLAAAEIAGGAIGRHDTDSTAADIVGGAFGVASLLIAVGSIVVGAVLVRGQAVDRVANAAAWLVLLSGVELVVVVTPANIGGDLDVRMAALMAWSAFFIALGLVLARTRAGVLTTKSAG